MAKFDNCTQNEKKHISVKFYNYFLDVKKSREKNENNFLGERLKENEAAL